MTKSSHHRIAILASGTGSNVRNILSYFERITEVSVAFVGSNRKDAGALNIAREFDENCLVFDNHFMTEKASGLMEEMHIRKVDYIILAGFLRKIPEEMVRSYSDRIINIHPSLLPRHGGKGMYGMHVHRAVKQAGDTKTGITIHVVNSEYDKGRVLFQAETEVTETDTPENIQEKVKKLEANYFPSIIHKFINDEI